MTAFKRLCFPTLIAFCFALMAPGIVVCQTATSSSEKAISEKAIPVSAQVVVSLCVAAGHVVVSGGERQEVRVDSEDAADLELHSVPAAAGSKTASQVEVRAKALIGGNLPLSRQCLAAGDLSLTVPRGAFVQLRTQSGDVTVSDVGAAKIEAMSGDVFLRDIHGAVEVATVSGDVSLENCRGTVQLRTISGNVEGINLRLSPNQNINFAARSVSGDINLEQAAYRHIEIGTVSGNISIDAELPRGAAYNIKSTTGDITLAMPSGASFKVLAKVPRGEIIDDFHVKPTAPASAHNAANALSGVRGSGEASLTLYSDSGTIHLRRQ